MTRLILRRRPAEPAHIHSFALGHMQYGNIAMILSFETDSTRQTLPNSTDPDQDASLVLSGSSLFAFGSPNLSQMKYST